MRKVAALTSWWDGPEQDITMPEISNSGVWVKNLNQIWSILVLGPSQWSINPTYILSLVQKIQTGNSKISFARISREGYCVSDIL
jgi:hypothetical protein